MESAKKRNNVFHEPHPREVCECQSPTQRGYGGGNKFRIGYALLLLYGGLIQELEVLEVWEEPDEVQDLPARPFGLLESEKTKGRCEMSETSLNVWHKIGYPEMIYPKFLEVCEGGKVSQGVVVESELVFGIKVEANAESLDERKQTELV